jgi:hypothetical protein
MATPRKKDAGCGGSGDMPRFHAFRAVLISTSPGGVRTTSLGVGGVGAEHVSRLVTDSDVIDTAEIAGWFESGWLTPNQFELKKLASALNVMRVTVHREDAAPPIALGRIKNAIAALSDELPTLIEVDRKTVELMRNSPSLAARLQTDLEVFENLLSAAQNANELLCLKAPPRRNPWFGDALWIASFLKMVGQRTGKRVSLTKSEGPAVIFIDTALNRARVPHVSREGIAKSMARYAKLRKAEVTINA